MVKGTVDFMPGGWYDGCILNTRERNWMKYELYFPTAPESLRPQDDNLDVCVRLENGEQYTLVVAKPEFLTRMMNQDGISYVRPGMPVLFAGQLTEDIIRVLVDELVQDLPLLRLYGSDLTE